MEVILQIQIERKIAEKGELTFDEGMFLYEEAPLEWLQSLANGVKESLYGEDVFYNRNIHFEPTNVCVYSCKFCSFYRKPNASESDGAWEYSFEDLQKKIAAYPKGTLTEVHITGGVHPDRGIEFGEELVRFVKELDPEIHVKAFTAVEITFFARKSKLTVEETLVRLHKAGLDSLPGGGAEIFDRVVRKKIAGGKSPAHRWLEVHESAHKLGMRSNATMLYGHIEKPEHRLKHMMELRELQKKHNGFMSFIPLRYLNENNALSELIEVDEDFDMRELAVARLFLNNFPHIKAYWVMLGMDVALRALKYGVDDLDGTIDDSTKIYSMAGGIQKPVYHSNELKELISKEGCNPVERNSLYEPRLS